MRKILTIVITALTLASCSNTKGLVEHSVEYRYIDRASVDTFYTDRWHTEYSKGDTIYIHDSIDRWHTRNNEVHDTLMFTDTITTTEYVEVEKRPTFWKRIGYLCKGGILAIAMVLVGVTFLRLRDKYITRD